MALHEMNPIEPSRYSEVVELLKFELSFLEEGGYGPSGERPYKSSSIFLDSPTCPNFHRICMHPCAECPLTYFVPLEHQSESVPCHRIQLNEAGETIRSIRRTANHEELEEAVKNWLRSTIQRLESLLMSSKT